MNNPSDERTPARVLLAWSSGKDAAWALGQLRADPGVEVVGLLTTLDAKENRVAMHGTHLELVEAQARAVGLPLHRVPLPSPCPNAEYERLMGVALTEAAKAGVTHLAFGDLHLEDVRDYRERQLAGSGIKPLFPLWGTETDALARQMVDAGVEAVVTSVDLSVLPATLVGRPYDHAFLDALPPGVDACGEYGEFHTFVENGPTFRERVSTGSPAPASRDRGFALAHLIRVALAVVALGISGCAAGGDQAPESVEPVVRDSSGIRVVEHPPGILSGNPADGRSGSEPGVNEPAAGGGRGWAPFALELDRGPTLRIGVVEGEEAYQFTNPVAGARLSDGTIVVVDRQTRTLRYFDARGQHLHTVGGQGGGPGEFQNPALLHRLDGDTLVVLDTQQQRLHWFGPDGRFVRDAGVGTNAPPDAGSQGESGAPTGRVSWIGPADDGGLFLSMTDVMMPGPGLTSGVIRSDARLAHRAPDGSGSALGPVPGGETEIRASYSEGELVSVEVRSYWFHARHMLVSGGTGVWQADGTRGEVTRFGGIGTARAGEPQLLVRFLDPPRLLTPAVRDTVERAALDAAADDEIRDRLRDLHASTPYPEQVPPVADLFGDAEGRLWVAPTRFPIRNLPQGMGRGSTHWFVLSPDGMPVGWVELPPASRPLWASDAGVLLVRLDELEVPYVEWWEAGTGGGA